jgi:cytochrome c biogenesis protein CcdA
VLGYLASESSSINYWGYIYIVIYNVIFILPMLAIAIAIAFGYKDLATMKEYREVHVEKLHLITGILML